MSEHRDRMMNAFKTRFVPALRKRGFAGSFPHFRRRLPNRIDHLTVQFYSAGGSFVVEVGRTGPDGFTEGPWKDLAVDRITVGHKGDGLCRGTRMAAGALETGSNSVRVGL